MFVYKHTETIKLMKKQPTFQEESELYGWITPQFSESRIQKILEYHFYIN